MMRVNLTVKGVAKTPTLDRLLHHKLHYAFDQFGHWVRHVAMVLEDVNGPKGGVDKRCRVTVSVPRHPMVVVDGRGADLLAVVTDAIDRVTQSLARLRDRRHTRRRHAAVAVT
ncbi:MAG: hypothetical protein B7Z55_06685 [Planctomycetales bacterium 12-60-4]|nr:MAG: hypothetical protein B7Z55_06685 [Planctomycetales bacterium 12-60-4]